MRHPLQMFIQITHQRGCWREYRFSGPPSTHIEIQEYPDVFPVPVGDYPFPEGAQLI